jgi:hypothetical protein
MCASQHGPTAESFNVPNSVYTREEARSSRAQRWTTQMQTCSRACLEELLPPRMPTQHTRAERDTVLGRHGTPVRNTNTGFNLQTYNQLRKPRPTLDYGLQVYQLRV